MLHRFFTVLFVMMFLAMIAAHAQDENQVSEVTSYRTAACGMANGKRFVKAPESNLCAFGETGRMRTEASSPNAGIVYGESCQGGKEIARRSVFLPQNGAVNMARYPKTYEACAAMGGNCFQAETHFWSDRRLSGFGVQGWACYENATSMSGQGGVRLQNGLIYTERNAQMALVGEDRRFVWQCTSPVGNALRSVSCWARCVQRQDQSAWTFVKPSPNPCYDEYLDNCGAKVWVLHPGKNCPVS